MASVQRGEREGGRGECEVHGECKVRSLGSGRERLQGRYCFLYSAQSIVKCLSVKIIYSESCHFKIDTNRLLPKRTYLNFSKEYY